MAKVKKINWAAAAKDKIPCYFDDDIEKLHENAIVSRLTGYHAENPFGIYYKTNERGYLYCEPINQSDREKYTEVEYTGRDNLIAALKECKPIKMEVTPEEFDEVIDLAISMGYNSESIKANTFKAYLYFCSGKTITSSFNRDWFMDLKVDEYLPTTDTFAQPEKKYRPCKNWEEFQQFMGKHSKRKNEEHYALIERVYFKKEFMAGTALWWFEEYTLLDGSPIGVEVE